MEFLLVLGLLILLQITALHLAARGACASKLVTCSAIG